MKSFFATILIVLSLQCFSQSTINFVSGAKGGYGGYKILMNDQDIGTIADAENLEYKMISEGRVSVIIIYGSFRHTGLIDVKKDGIYYFEINPYWNRFGVVDEKKGQKLLSKTKNTIKANEKSDNPIIKK